MARTSDEQIIYGVNAALAAAKMRRNDIIRAYVTEENLKPFNALLKSLAAKKRAYHVVSAAELTKLTSSIHHEGISLLVKAAAAISPEELLDAAGDRVLLVGLVGVSNPHNIGAIARSAAHFGASGLIFTKSEAEALSASAYRVAQGGMEHLPVAIISAAKLQNLKKLGLKLIAPSPHKGTPLSKFKFPARSVLLFGEEGEGLSAPVEKLADSLVTIPGTGNVESLNVSAAAAIFLQHWHSQS